MNKLYRQGDLLIMGVDKLPTKLKDHSEVLLEGETTGHAHRLQGGSAFEGENGMLYLQIANIGEIVHEEHNRIELPAGNYQVVRQREYQSNQMVRLVVD
ncbi:MAG: hypothetical protein ACREQ5_12310 [Candidatus Dormibacteria bacterium]